MVLEPQKGKDRILMFRKKVTKLLQLNLLCKQNTNGNTNAKQTAQKQKTVLFLPLVDWKLHSQSKRLRLVTN